MQRGYTKSWRKKYESRTASRGIVYLGAMDYFAGNANWRDKFHSGILIQRGQMIVGRKQLSETWKLSEQNVRTILKNLEKDGFLTTQTSNLGTIVTVLNYDIYQADDGDCSNESQPELNQPITNGQPLLKNIKNIKNNNMFFAYDGDCKIHGISQEQLALWKSLFPQIAIDNEINKASAWLDANRNKKKKDIKKFLAGWFNRSTNNDNSHSNTIPQNSRNSTNSERSDSLDSI